MCHILQNYQKNKSEFKFRSFS